MVINQINARNFSNFQIISIKKSLCPSVKGDGVYFLVTKFQKKILRMMF